MRSRILLTGKNGQVGSELALLLPRMGDVMALARQELDLSKPDDIRRAIRQCKPHLIVNAAAYTAVDQAEKEEPLAHAINAIAPGVMAEEAKKIGAALIHYSTDYVFDGSKGAPYEVDDRPNPRSAYGRSKLAGEQRIEDSGVPHLIFRTAWVYATRGKNFLLTVLRLGSQREELKIVSDQLGSPTWCRSIAKATASILEPFTEPGGISGLTELSGVYHLTAGGVCSWYDFTQAILDEARRVPPDLPWIVSATGGHVLVTKKVVPITTSEYPTAASRPPYSVLSNSRTAEVFGVEAQDWRAELHAAFTSG
jgi:dTDP-4-dehydrorhamnose reductase